MRILGQIWHRMQSIINDTRFPKRETVVTANSTVKYNPIVAEFATNTFCSLLIVNGQ